MLGIGTTLGPYRIEAPLGAGGMGEVWRARDARLQREVAIKLLPTRLAGNTAALARLRQEARTVAALNHPNLLVIHDVGTAPDGALYLVCELLKGESLRARLRGGALPPRQALEFGAQIARGLAAAHGQGIIHRDLKPENLFCTSDGRIKILDFGLAKLTGPAAGEAETLTAGAPATAAGAVLGTVGYMAPEQARGLPADARSDIFSLGAVLFEMLTGERAFRRESAVETLGAILHEDAPPLTLADGALATRLDRLVRHCLEKDAARRFQSADDLAFALESAAEVFSHSSMSGGGAGALADTLPSPRRRRRVAFTAVGTLALLAAVTATWALARRRAPWSPRFQQITWRDGTILAARFLPGGNGALATLGNADTDKFQAVSLRFDTPSEAFSDGGYDAVAAVGRTNAAVLQHYAKANGWERAGTLALLPLGGGAPRPVLTECMAADFAPGGDDVSGLLVVRYHPDTLGSTLEYPAGKVLYTTSGWVSNPRFSRDGREIAFLDHPTSGDDYGRVLVIGLDGRVRRQGPWFGSTQTLAWSPNGADVWYGAGATESHEIHSLSSAGADTVLLSGPGGLEIEDATADGRVLVKNRSQRVPAFLVRAGGSAPREVTVLNWSNSAALSAQDDKLLIGDETANPQYANFLEDAQGSPPIRLGDGNAIDLSGDGQWALAKVPDAHGQNWQLWIEPTGAGTPRQLTHGDTQWQDAHFVPGQRAVVAAGSAPGQAPQMFLLDWNGGARALAAPGVLGDWPTPDGKWIVALNQGRAELIPIAGGAVKPLPAAHFTLGEILSFGEDDDTLYVEPPPAGAEQTVERMDLATGKTAVIFRLPFPERASEGAPRVIAVSADGKTCVYVYSVFSDALYLVRGLR